MQEFSPDMRDLGKIDEHIGSSAACSCRIGSRLAAPFFSRVVGLVATATRHAAFSAHR